MAAIRQSPGCDTTDFSTCSVQINTLSQTKLPQRKSSWEKDRDIVSCFCSVSCMLLFHFLYWILTAYYQVGTPPKEPPLSQSLKHLQTIDLLLEFKQKKPTSSTSWTGNQEPAKRPEHMAAISEHHVLKRRHCKNRGKCFLHLESCSEHYFPHLPPAPWCCSSFHMAGISSCRKADCQG